MAHFIQRALVGAALFAAAATAAASTVTASFWGETRNYNDGNAVITPHLGEMSRMLSVKPEDISRNPEQRSLDTAAALNAVVVLKGSRTFIASPRGDLSCYESGDVGLATSGSGDTLAGVVAGLVARGTDPLHAALWAVFLHGSAGNRLANRMGRIGYLARELLDEIPPIMNRF